MGASSSQATDPTSLMRGLAASIRETMKPTRSLVEEVWACSDPAGSGLGKEQVRLVLDAVLERQIQDAKQNANAVKIEMAKQQAHMEKCARNFRHEVLEAASKPLGSSAASDEVDAVASAQLALDRASAFNMGSQAGPVMAGMMAGYVDIPVTCLSAMKEDTALLDTRIELMFKLAAADRLSCHEFTSQYVSFYDHAPDVLEEEADQGSYDCSVQ